MTNHDNLPTDPADLRQKAEALAREPTARSPEGSAVLSPEEVRKTLHELRVHKIELEMQNEELRTAQTEIEAGRARYFDLYNLAPVGYCTLSEQGLILEANLTAAILLGSARSLLTKQSISRYIFREDQDIYYLHRRKLFDTGELQEFELRLVKPDGTAFWAHLTVTAAQAEDGVPVCRVVIIDITGRKLAEESIADQQELLAAIYGNAPLVLMVVDKERRIQQINGFAAQFSGRSGLEFMGLREGEDLRCLHVLDAAEGCGFGEYCRQCVIRNTVHDTLETGRAYLRIETPCHFVRNDETIEMTFLLSTTPITVKGARMALVTMQDITELKLAEAEKTKLEGQLQQAQKIESVGRLAGGVAHDFNNMLGVILGHVELSLDSIGPDHPLRPDLEEIRNAAQRSADLTRQLLAFARKQTISPRVLDLNNTVEGMLNMLRRLIGENINLAWKPDPGLWPVKMDPTQIDQLLANLCVNARDAITGDGMISVETRNITLDEEYCAQQAGFTPGEYVGLNVSDDGCGIDSQTLLLIFEPFFTTKEMGKGTGLGLATVYGIVKQNNGFINVYSEQGQGTTFSIYLPRHAAEKESLPKQVPIQAVSHGHKTILLVEDEPAILRMTTIMLERQGYTVMVARTSSEAIRLAGEHAGRIDLLLTDMVMPEMNGHDLARNLASIDPSLKCLYMSGYTADILAHHGVLGEGEQFIQKPFSLKELTAKLREVLES